jgi:hypothetical protein
VHGRSAQRQNARARRFFFCSKIYISNCYDENRIADLAFSIRADNDRGFDAPGSPDVGRLIEPFIFALDCNTLKIARRAAFPG